MHESNNDVKDTKIEKMSRKETNARQVSGSSGLNSNLIKKIFSPFIYCFCLYFMENNIIILKLAFCGLKRSWIQGMNGKIKKKKNSQHKMKSFYTVEFGLCHL